MGGLLVLLLPEQRAVRTEAAQQVAAREAASQGGSQVAEEGPEQAQEVEGVRSKDERGQNPLLSLGERDWVSEQSTYSPCPAGRRQRRSGARPGRRGQRRPKSEGLRARPVRGGSEEAARRAACAETGEGKPELGGDALGHGCWLLLAVRVGTI